MNTVHMRYAVEVARAGSINRAAEEIYVAQPNLSRAIKELESDLGITIFDRSPKGMELTAHGSEFIQYAEKIIEEIDELERRYRFGSAQRRRFSVSAPRSCYIADAFAAFTTHLGPDPAEVLYCETGSAQAMNAVCRHECGLALVRTAQKYVDIFDEMLTEKGLVSETAATFHRVLLMSAECELAARPVITHRDLADFIEVRYADPFSHSLSFFASPEERRVQASPRCIRVMDRSVLYCLLTNNTSAFSWGSPMPQDRLDIHGLVMRSCEDDRTAYRDVIIRRADYELSDLDELFIREVHSSRARAGMGTELVV